VVAGGVQLWEEGGAKQLVTFRPSAPSPDYRAAFSPDGKMVVMLHGNIQGTSAFGESSFWDAREGSKLGECRHSDTLVRGDILAWSPDGKTLAVSLLSPNGVALFRAPWKRMDKTIARPSWVGALAWSPDSKNLATVENDKVVRVLDVESEKVVAEIKEPKTANPGLVPAWSLDGKELAFGTDDMKVVVWNRGNQKVTYTFEGHTRSITAVAFLGDNKTLVSASGGSVRFWDLEKPRLRGTLLNLSGSGWLAIGPDGNHRCSPGAENRFVYKVREDTNRVRELSPEEFRSIYGWKNRPEQVQLVPEPGGR
jgi:WD40 repeat protein